MGLKVLSDLIVGNVKFPAADGSNGQVLRTDGSGNLHFATMVNSDTKLSGLSFNTGSGVLTATLSDSNTVTVDLDGRYAAAAHVHDYDNYSSWNLKTNGTQRTTVQSGGTLDLIAGSNVALSYGAGGKVTISSTDTDTNSVDYLNSASFNTGNGVLSLGGVGRAGASVDLDGRYAYSSHNHTSLTGVSSIGFAAQSSDSASITTTISGTSTFFDFNLADDNNNDWWRWRFTPSGGTVYDAMILKPASNGNANLTISGSVYADNLNISNWNTAHSWGNHADAGYLKTETYTAHENSSNLSGFYGGNNNGIVIEDITVDSNGHVTGVGTRDLDGRFDSAGSADAVNQRIDEEVLPKIPTNNNELVNGAGYITDGNTGWNNSYGFITASSTNTLTNKSGNISQWTNDAGYITDGNSGWNNSYGFITASSTNTLTNKSGNISQWTNDSGYLREETITKLSISGNILSYLNEAGDVAEIDLSLYLDDTNAARLTSGTLNNTTGVATFKRDDNSTFTVDFSALFDNVNNYADSLSFNTGNGILTLGRNGSLADLTVDLDGRYQGAGNYFTDGDSVINMANNDGFVYDDVNNRMYVKLDGTDREIYHTGNFNPASYLTTTGKAADSNLLDGLDLGGTRANVANKVVRTDSSGYTNFGWINTTSGNTTSTITDFYVNTNDGYIRKATKDHVKSQLGLGSAAYVATSAFDAAGTGAAAAAAVDQRIDEEVLPSIPTNNNQLANGAGYLTTSGKAADANLLDGINSGSFLRSDATDYLNATLYLRGDVVNSGNGYRDHGVFGTYDSSKTDHIWSMGTAYRNNKDGVNFGNLYGLAYKHTNNATGGTMAGGHQMVWCTNGTPRAALGEDGAWTASHGTSANWKQAYDNYITGASFSGTSTKTLTLTQRDGGTITATFADRDTNTWRGIDDVPVNGQTGESISSNWAYDHANASNPHGITLSGLGFTGATNANYITNNSQISNGRGYLTSTNDRVYITDSRGGFRLPNYYNDRYAQWDFQSSTDTGGKGDAWHGVLTVAKWSSFDPTHRQEQLLFTGDELKRRTAASDSEWGEVKTIWDTGNLNALTNATVSNDTITFTKADGSTFAVTTSDANTNTNYYLNGITRSGNTLTFSVSGTTNRTYTFGSNAFNSTTIPTNNNQLTNGAGYIKSYVNTQRSDAEIRAVTSKQFVDGDNVTFVQEGDNIIINAKDTNTNTTYSAGTGLTLSGTTFSLSSTYDNYNGWDLYTNGTSRGRITAGENVNFAAGSNVSLSYSSTNNTITINSTDTNTNTTYSADGNHGLFLSGTTFGLENDRRRNSSTTDIYTGNTHDFTFYDASVGIRWYTAGSEDMRLYDNGTLHVDGDIIAYSTTISDARLKDDVVTITNAVDKIKALRGVEYTWNAGTRKDKRDLGLIAQEVEEVLPEIVHEHDMPLMDGAEEGEVYKTVDYEKIVGVLIEGMKEQQAEIDLLKAEVKALKQK